MAMNMLQKIFSLSLVLVGAVLFSSCSGKKYYEPKEIEYSHDFNISSSTAPIYSFSDGGATLFDHTLIAQNSAKSQVPKGFEYINYTNKQFISADSNNTLMIGKKKFQFDNIVVAANIKDNLIALVFIDNSIALYDTDKKKFVFKEYLQNASSVNTKIANPVFMDQLLLYPSLDGKIIVVDINSAQNVRDIVVDTDNDFKNIIFLQVLGERLVAASNNKIVSVGTDFYAMKEYEIKDVITHKNNLYLTTIDGRIIMLNSKLQEQSSKKFKFAKILTLGFGTKLYALESQGYLIELSPDLDDYTVFQFDFDNTQKVITLDNKIFFEDKYFTLP